MSTPEEYAYRNQRLAARQETVDEGLDPSGFFASLYVAVIDADSAYICCDLASPDASLWHGIAFFGEGGPQDLTVITDTYENACDAAEALRREFAAALEEREGGEA